MSNEINKLSISKKVDFLWSSPYAAFLGMAVLFYVLTYFAAFGLSNADTYFHLRVGEEIYSGQWRPWDMGHFNALDNANWSSTQWLSQWGLAATYNLGGYHLLVALDALLYLLLAFGIYYILRSYTAPIVACLLAVSYVAAHLATFSLRPQMISFFLILLTTHIWLQAAKKKSIPWMLIPIFLLWPNFHGMWIAGLFNSLVIAIVYAIQAGWRDNLKILYIPLAAFFVTLLNPVGPKIWTSVISITSLATGAEWDEWGAPDYAAFPYVIAFAALLLTIILMAGQRSATPVEITILALSIGWALYSQRSAPFAMLMFLPLLASALAPSKKIPNFSLKEKNIVAALAVVMLISLGARIPSDPTEAIGVDPWVSAKLTELPKNTTVYTDFHVGSFALQTAPQINLPVHGYADAFTPDEINRLYSLIGLKPGWPEVLRKIGATYALWPTDHPITYALRQEGWLVVKKGIVDTLLQAPPDWQDTLK